MDQRNKTKSPEINSHVYGQLVGLHQTKKASAEQNENYQQDNLLKG